jgi:hypothetical protein
MTPSWWLSRNKKTTDAQVAGLPAEVRRFGPQAGNCN